MTHVLVDPGKNLKNVVHPRVSFKLSKLKLLVTLCKKRPSHFLKNARRLKEKTKKSCRKKKHLL